MPRTSMASIIAFLRQYGNAATDEVFNGVTYWDDDQLEAIADSWSSREVVRLHTIQLESPTIYTLSLPKFHFMEDDFTVYDSSDVEVATAATYNQNRQELTFVSALDANEEYTLQALVVRGYDALADLWTQKASQREDYVDFKAGNNKMNMKQEHDNCLQKAAYYRAKTIRRWPRQKGRWTV